MNRQLRTLEKECTEYEILPNPGAVSLGMLQVMGEMDKLLEELHGKELPEQLLEFYFCVRDFLNIDELLDENYVVYTEREKVRCSFLRPCFPWIITVHF